MFLDALTEMCHVSFRELCPSDDVSVRAETCRRKCNENLYICVCIYIYLLGYIYIIWQQYVFFCCCHRINSEDAKF